jgi:DNA-directed RNA polymerase subunit RPC12/RpoP
MLKTCSKCNEEKEISEFYKRKDGYVLPNCKKCSYEMSKSWRKKTQRGKIKLRDVDYSGITDQKCITCEETKELSHFPKDKRLPIGYRHECKECFNKRNRESYHNPNGTRRKYLVENREDRLRMYKDIKCRKKYGLTIDEVKELHEEQNYKCAICKEKFDVLCVDHNHDTGEVRELLCNNCNSGIGMLKDNVELVKSAYEYLLKHRKEV